MTLTTERVVVETPIKEATLERKISSRGFSEISSTYGLRGRDFVEKFTTPAKKALASVSNLSLTPKTKAASKEFDPMLTANAVRLIAAQSASACASVLINDTNARLPRASSPKDLKEPAVKRKQKKSSEKGKKKCYPFTDSQRTRRKEGSRRRRDLHSIF